MPANATQQPLLMQYAAVQPTKPLFWVWGFYTMRHTCRCLARPSRTHGITGCGLGVVAVQASKVYMPTAWQLVRTDREIQNIPVTILTIISSGNCDLNLSDDAHAFFDKNSTSYFFHLASAGERTCCLLSALMHKSNLNRACRFNLNFKCSN